MAQSVTFSGGIKVNLRFFVSMDRKQIVNFSLKLESMKRTVLLYITYPSCVQFCHFLQRLTTKVPQPMEAMS